MEKDINQRAKETVDMATDEDNQEEEEECECSCDCESQATSRTKYICAAVISVVIIAAAVYMQDPWWLFALLVLYPFLVES